MSKECDFFVIDSNADEWGFSLLNGQIKGEGYKGELAATKEAILKLMEYMNSPQETPKKETNLCDAIKVAADIVVNARDAQYGDPKVSFVRIAQLASLMVNKEITATDVVNIQIAVKLMRESYKHKEDNLVDVIGYSDILNYIKGA